MRLRLVVVMVEVMVLAILVVVTVVAMMVVMMVTVLSRTRMQYTELGRKDKEVGRTAEGEARLEAWTRQGGVPI